MRNLSIYDVVRLTVKIQDATSKQEDTFGITTSGDRISFLPYDFGEVSNLKVYFNESSIETIRVDYFTGSSISNMKIIDIIESIDEKITDRLRKERNK